VFAQKEKEAMMTIERLHDLFESHAGSTLLSFEGKCHDCKKEVNVKVAAGPEGFAISGGALFEPEPDRFYTKCDDCYRTSPRLSNYQKCEVYSRVVGYLRPVSQWNEGKQAEFADRKTYRVPQA
jgi:ribonucleoside-triphosphate reductase